MRQEKNRVKAQEKYHVNKTTKTIYVRTAPFDQAFVFIRSIICLPSFVFFNGYVPRHSIKCASAEFFFIRSIICLPTFVLCMQSTFVFTFVFHPSPSEQHTGGLMHFGAKLKIDYIVLNVKLLLINMNYVEFFHFLEILQIKKV